MEGMIMADKMNVLKILLWIGIVLFFLWFVIFCFAPQSILIALEFVEIEGYFLRMFGILPLCWAILFFFALKDPMKNAAIIRCGIITADLMILATVIYHYAVERISSWFNWTSILILFAYSSLLWIFKPKTD
jgi:hypothetical protein